MKLIIITLTMIFIGFGASAKTMSLGQLYKDCKIYQRNGFTLKKLQELDIYKSILCVSTFKTMINEGGFLCEGLKQEHKLEPNSKSLLFVAIMRANSIPIDVSQAIMTFINYAEKHPKRWDEPYQFFRNEFMSAEYPCDLKKP